MFTVIIAEKVFIDLFNKFETFLLPLFDKEKIAFCAWNKAGKNLDEAVPELYDIIAQQKSWRAIIVSNDNINCINPFDAVDYKTALSESITDKRSARLSLYEKAIDNPLTKLTSALCGAPVFKSTVEDEDLFNDIISGNIELRDYMLKRTLGEINTTELAGYIEAYQQDRFSDLVPADKVAALIEAMKNKDASKITELVTEDGVIDFILDITNSDPFYSDSEYVEKLLENTRKKQLFSEISRAFSLKDKAPEDVICVSSRTFDFVDHKDEVMWNDIDESRYSAFAQFNMYPEQLKYLLFDVLPEDNRQYVSDQIRMLCFLLVFAANETPRGAITQNRVYKVDLEFDQDSIKKYCTEYVGKLKATVLKINETIYNLNNQEPEVVDNKTSQNIFESEADIPVEINSDFNKKDLMAKYKSIGLATDCPTDESSFWSGQYHSISKLFVRYLREPRRAVKTAVKEGFRKQNKIEDERALQLNEFQSEDVVYKLLEEEQKMVETTTTQLFNTAEYNKRLDEADKQLKRTIAKRMSKLKTVLVSLVAALAYLIGLIPLFFGEINTEETLKNSAIIALVTLLVFLLLGFIYLFVLRRRLVNVFKHFNYVMSGILTEIEVGLKDFSKYLGHACNVMREFSVINYKESEAVRQTRVLRKHENDIKIKIDNIYELFSGYIDTGFKINDTIEPYAFDFTQLRDYIYEMPYLETYSVIEYIQKGHCIPIKVDYVHSISLTREELYD